MASQTALYRCKVRTSDGKEALSEIAIEVPSQDVRARIRFGRSEEHEEPAGEGIARGEDDHPPPKALNSKGYRKVSEVMDELAAAAKHPGFKLAITITGGGARGAYEAGAVEGLLRQLSSHPEVKPSIVAGTSAGAIVSMALWVDLCYPKAPGGLYRCRQSELWRKLCDGNNASSALFDKPWLIGYLTHKKVLPVWGDIQKDLAQLNAAMDAFQRDLKTLDGRLRAVKDTVSTQGVAQLVTDANTAASAVNTDLTNLQGSWDKLSTDLDAVGSADVWDEGDAIRTALTDFFNLSGSVGSWLSDASSNLGTVLDHTGKLASGDLQTVLSALPGIFDALALLTNDAGGFAGSLADVIARVSAVAAVVLALLPLIDLLIIPAAVGAAVALPNHLLEADGLERTLRDFIQHAPHLPVAAGSIERAVAHDWRHQHQQGKGGPELYLTGSNLTASRETIFAVAAQPSVDKLGSAGYWVVDLAATEDSGQPNVFRPSPLGTEVQSIVKATLTSAAIPAALPSRLWRIHGIPGFGGQPRTFHHVCVDGGVMDNSPVEIARRAGATHILSLELKPLNYFDAPAAAASETPNALALIGASFDAAMNSATFKSIQQIINGNGIDPDGAIHVYRLAPLSPADDPHSIDTFEFDGKYDATTNALRFTLYDWFMQGYVDASDEEPGLTKSSDAVVKDYLASAGNTKQLSARQNRIWDATHELLPSALPVS